MSQAKKPQLPKFTTGRGKFVYPKLHAPDTKFNKAGVFSVKFRVASDGPVAKGLIQALTPHLQEAERIANEEFAKLPIAQRKKLGKVSMNPLFSEVYDKETEQPTGDVDFIFKMTASGETKAGKKWTRRPHIFDGQGNLISNPPEMWSGTEGKIRFAVRPYFVPGTGAAGLSLLLEGAQIINLVAGNSASAESMGFGAEEDGYAYEAPTETPSTNTNDADASGDF